MLISWLSTPTIWSSCTSCNARRPTSWIGATLSHPLWDGINLSSLSWPWHLRANEKDGGDQLPDALNLEWSECQRSCWKSWNKQLGRTHYFSVVLFYSPIKPVATRELYSSGIMWRFWSLPKYLTNMSCAYEVLWPSHCIWKIKDKNKWLNNFFLKHEISIILRMGSA